MEDLKIKCLLNSTQKVLKKLIQNEYMSSFVLVGGSALALYLCHRLSEDLDFFTYEDSLDVAKIREMAKDFQDKEFVNITDEQVDLFLDGVKVTFFNAKWSFLKPKKITNLNVATLEQIAVMKTNVLFLRAKYRDYYDLYFLSKRFGLDKIFELSKEILEGINYKLFVSAMLFIEDIEDEDIKHLKPTEKISLKNIREEFEDMIKKEKL